MAATIPVDFQQKVLLPKGQTASDYPYAIKATDLMQNFVFATLDIDDSLVESFSGQNGHAQRRLKIPALPTSGTYVLGAVSGAFTWIATQDC
jgi:hypothetical protein